MVEPYPSNQANSQENDTHISPDLLTQVQEQEAPTVGVDVKQVNPTISYVVEKVFAKPLKGQEFLSLLLTQAEVKQETLADSIAQTPTSFAVVALQNIRELASRIHWGYDTTHKYVVTFCALNLLLKRRCNNHIELLFPLQHYDPPSSLTELDRLLTKSRPKVQQFARRVRERCILYNIISSSPSTAQVSDIAPLSPEQELIGQLHSILRAENIETERCQRLVTRISSEIVSRLLTYPTAQASPQRSRGRLATHAAPAIIESTLSGRLLSNATIATPTKSTPSVDSPNLQVNHEEEESTKRVDFSALHINHEEEKSTEREESLPLHTDREKESTERVDSSSLQISNNNKKSTSSVDSSLLKLGYKQQESTGEDRPFDLNSTKHIQKSTEHKTVDFRPQSTFQAQRAYKKPTALNDLINRSSLFKQPVDSSRITKKESTPEPVESPLVESTPEQPVDSLPTVVDSTLDTQTLAVDSPTKTVDSQINQNTMQTSLPAVVDSCEKAASLAALSPEENLSKSTVETHETVDFDNYQAIKSLKDPSAFSSEFLALYVTLNVNEFITEIYKNISNNHNVTLRKDLQMFLAEIFEGDRKDWSKHSVLLQTVDAHALASGFVYTMQCLLTPGGGSINSPAAFFTSRCKAFMDGQSNDKQELVDFLLQMTCEQLFAYLMGRYTKSEGLSPFLQQLREEAKADEGLTRVKEGRKIVYRKKKFASAKMQKKEEKEEN